MKTRKPRIYGRRWPAKREVSQLKVSLERKGYTILRPNNLCAEIPCSIPSGYARQVYGGLRGGKSHEYFTPVRRMVLPHSNESAVPLRLFADDQPCFSSQCPRSSPKIQSRPFRLNLFLIHLIICNQLPFRCYSCAASSVSRL